MVFSININSVEFTKPVYKTCKIRGLGWVIFNFQNIGLDGERVERWSDFDDHNCVHCLICSLKPQSIPHTNQLD